jgi:hypothetical protein
MDVSPASNQASRASQSKMRTLSSAGTMQSNKVVYTNFTSGSSVVEFFSTDKAQKLKVFPDFQSLQNGALGALCFL